MSLIKELDLSSIPDDKLYDAIDQGIRHKSGSTHFDYLKSFLRVSRPLAYATHDESWGEFEKEFSIIILRMLNAERALNRLQIAAETERSEKLALISALGACVASLERADTEEGFCCCGDSIDSHGYSSNHSPVDIGHYYANLALTAAKAALAGHADASEQKHSPVNSHDTPTL